MQILFFILLGVVLVGLVSGTFMFWSLSYPASDGSVKDIPYLSIIIPARNEAERLPILLKSIQEQHFKSYELLVIDDASEDCTAEVANSYGASVIKNEPVNNMSSGKSVACAVGARRATGKWLLFLDADVQFEDENSLQRILSAYHHQHAKGILSVQPYHKIEKAYENMSAIFNVIVLTGMNVFTRWKHTFKTAGSFGPCILCDRKSYVNIGGHESAEDSIMDDFALSDVFIANQLPVTNYAGRGSIRLRMYPEGIQQLIEGWTKNLATASSSTHWFVMLMIQLWIGGGLIAGIAPLIALTHHTTLTMIAIVVYLLYGVHVLYLGRKAGNFHALIILFYPLLFLFFVCVFLYSSFRTHVLRTVMWKGRKIKL